MPDAPGQFRREAVRIVSRLDDRFVPVRTGLPGRRDFGHEGGDVGRYEFLGIADALRQPHEIEQQPLRLADEGGR